MALKQVSCTLAFVLMGLAPSAQASTLTTGSLITCSFKSAHADKGMSAEKGVSSDISEEFRFVWSEDREFGGKFKKTDLLGRERPDWIKAQVRPLSAFDVRVVNSSAAPPINLDDEYVAFQAGSLFTSRKRGPRGEDPKMYRVVVRLVLNVTNPKGSRIHQTVEEGREGMMGFFEPSAGRPGSWIPASCEIKSRRDSAPHIE